MKIQDMLFLGVICTFGLLTNAQPPFSLPTPDPITGTVQSTATATGFLPDTGSNWFDSQHHSLEDNVGTPFIPGPESPFSIYNKPEVLDPFYAKTNVFHHHHHFIIPVHKHTKHIHHHHHHNHHIHHHRHPTGIHHQDHHYYNHHHHIHKNLHTYPSTLLSVINHDGTLHNYKHQTKLHSFGTGLQIASNNLNAGHQAYHSNAFAIDPSVADTVSLPMIKTAPQHHIHEPVVNNVITHGPFASQTGYGVPNNQLNGIQALSDHHLNINAANNEVYGNNQNTFIAAPGAMPGINGFNNQIIESSHVENNLATQNAMNSATTDNLVPTETIVDGTSAQSLTNSNSLSGGIDQTHGNTDILSNAHAKSETGAHLMDTTFIAGDQRNVQTALPVSHVAANADTTNVANIHAAPEQSIIPQEVHHFVADSNDNELHEVNNLPLQFFSQGHKVTTVGDHASLEADHAIVEAGLSEDHPDHHLIDSLNEHHHQEESVEHIMPSTGAIHVTEDSHGHVHKHINGWNEAEHDGLHDVHVEESHNKQPYAIHVSDNGNGYAVQAEEYHDHEDGHVMENDVNHIVGLDHADHISSSHIMTNHDNTDHEIIDHGISNHEFTHNGIIDHGITDHEVIDHGITNHGLADHELTNTGITDHGLTDHGVIDHGIIDHGNIDNDVSDHEITDALTDIDAIDDHEAAIHANDHATVDIGHSAEEIIHHVTPVHHELNDHHTIVSQEIHDPGIHVNFHAIEHGNELYGGVDNPEHGDIHINSAVPMTSHGHLGVEHTAVEHTAVEPVTESHETTHMVYEHSHEEPHIELHHDDHRDYHDGGIAPELVETNIHSNSVPEYNGNNPMTYLHDVAGHETGHDVRHDIHEFTPHDIMNAGMHGAEHEGIPAATNGVYYDLGNDGIHQNMHLASDYTTDHPDEHAHTSNVLHQHADIVHDSPHDLGVHGFDEHGAEFLINRDMQHHVEHEVSHAQTDDANLVDRSEENQVHLDEKDAELLKKAKENEIIDPPYLTHLDPHGDGFGEGVVGGPDLNIGNSLQTGAAISSTFPATIPNSSPFVGDHPATMVHNGNIAPDYGSKRQKFEKAEKEHVKSGFVSIGSPKKGNTIGNKITGSTRITGKINSAKPKLSNFIKGNKKESVSFFANDRDKKAEQTFETIPNEPRILTKTDPNKGTRKENSKDSTKITSIGVEKENEHNITNGVSSNVGNNGEEHQNGAKVETNGKDLEQSNSTENHEEENSKTAEGEKDGSTQHDEEPADDVKKEAKLDEGKGKVNENENEEKNGTSSNQNKANNSSTEENKMEEKKNEETFQNGTFQGTNQNNSGNKTTHVETVKLKDKKQIKEWVIKPLIQNTKIENSSTTTKTVENLVVGNENENSSKNVENVVENNNKAEEIKGKDENLENKDETSYGKEADGTKISNGNARKENNEEETIKNQAKMKKDLKSSEKEGNKTKVFKENVENTDARDFASGSGEGSGETDGSKGKKLTTKTEDNNKGEREKSNKENDEMLSKTKRKNSKDMNFERKENNFKQNDNKQSTKEIKKFTKANTVDNITKSNEGIEGNDKNLNKSKAKGKKGDKNKNDAEQNGDLVGDKGREGNAEKKPQNNLKEEIRQENSASAVEDKNMTKGFTGSSMLMANNERKMKEDKASNSTWKQRTTYTKKQDKPQKSNENEISNNVKYQLHGGDTNGEANEEHLSSKEGSGNDEIQEVDEEGKIIERSQDAQGEETSTLDENGFEKVGPQKNASSGIENKDTRKPEDEINVSVDKEEWKSSEENNNGKQSISIDQENKENDNTQENPSVGDSSNGLITIEQNDMSQETGPTESPTQFYVAEKSEGSGMAEAPTELAPTQPDAVQATTENNSHELDGITNSEKNYARGNEENTPGIRDPIDVIETNTETVHNTKNTASDERELFGEESSNNNDNQISGTTYSNIAGKSKIGRQKPTDAPVHKRNKLPHHRNDKQKWKQGAKSKKLNVATRLAGKRYTRYHGRTDTNIMNSNVKISQRIRKRRAVSIYNILRRILLTEAILKGKQR